MSFASSSAQSVCRSSRKISAKVRSALREGFFENLADRPIYWRADHSPSEGQGLHETLENIGALDRAL